MNGHGTFFGEATEALYKGAASVDPETEAYLAKIRARGGPGALAAQQFAQRERERPATFWERAVGTDRESGPSYLHQAADWWSDPNTGLGLVDKARRGASTWAPIIGGTLGGLVGAVPGAALGAGIGSYLGQTAERPGEDTNLAQTALSAGLGAAGQGVAQVGGRLLGGALGRLGGRAAEAEARLAAGQFSPAFQSAVRSAVPLWSRAANAANQALPNFLGGSGAAAGRAAANAAAWDATKTLGKGLLGAATSWPVMGTVGGLGALSLAANYGPDVLRTGANKLIDAGADVMNHWRGKARPIAEDAVHATANAVGGALGAAGEVGSNATRGFMDKAREAFNTAREDFNRAFNRPAKPAAQAAPPVYGEQPQVPGAPQRYQTTQAGY